MLRKIVLLTVVIGQIIAASHQVMAGGIIAEQSESVDVGEATPEVVATASAILRQHQTGATKQSQRQVPNQTTYDSPLPANCTWESVGAKHGVSPSLLYAIAKTESSFNPRARNVNKDGSEDVGLMQINSSWYPTLKKFGVTRELLFNPCINLDVGAWVLGSNMREMGVSWKAVGAYNAKNPAKRLKYAQAVYNNIPPAYR